MRGRPCGRHHPCVELLKTSDRFRQPLYRSFRGWIQQGDPGSGTGTSGPGVSAGGTGAGRGRVVSELLEKAARSVSPSRGLAQRVLVLQPCQAACRELVKPWFHCGTADGLLHVLEKHPGVSLVAICLLHAAGGSGALRHSHG